MRSVSAALALVVATLAHGCGFSVYEGMYRVFLMRPEVAGFHELAPFYFTTNKLFEADRSITASMRVSEDRNVLEWQAHVGTHIPLADIREVLYDVDPVRFWNEFDALSARNALLKHLAEKDPLLLEYLRFARRCERVINNYDPWELEGVDLGGIDRAIADGERMHAGAKDDFLRSRAGYQLVRLAFYKYGGLTDDCRQYYLRRVMPAAGDSWIGPSARFYAAHSLPTDSFHYELSRAFDEGIDKRFRCAALFPRDSLKGVLTLAKNDHERAVMYAMVATHRFGRAATDLERIARLDPTNKFLPFLLVREVNKLEDWLMTPALTEFKPASRINWWQDTLQVPVPVRADQAYAQRVHALVHQLIAKGDPGQRALFNLLAAHLSLVTGNIADADEHLAKAEHLPKPDNKHLLAQLRMERVMLDFIRSPRLTPSMEQAIAEAAEALDTGDDVVEGRVMRAQFYLFLADKLFDAGDIPRGVLMLCHTERAFGVMFWGYETPLMELEQRARPEDYEALRALLEKKDKSPFEHWLTDAKAWQATGRWDSDDVPVSSEKLLDLESMWYVNQDRMPEALTVLQRIPDDYWRTYPRSAFLRDDPFRVDVADPNNYAKKDLLHYNKRQLVDELVCLKEEAVKHPEKAALNAYLIGNAYFNMSWYGKYWIMSSTWWSGEQFNEPWSPHNEAFEDHFLRLSRAKTWYLRSMRTAKDPELKALACFMVTYCDQQNDEEGERRHLHKRELRDSLSRAAYEGINECLGYDDYIARYR